MRPSRNCQSCNGFAHHSGPIQTRSCRDSSMAASAPDNPTGAIHETRSRNAMGLNRIIVSTLARLGAAAYLLGAGCSIPVAEPLAPPLATWGSPVEVARFDLQGRPLGTAMIPAPVRNEALWRAQLGPQGYAV